MTWIYDIKPPYGTVTGRFVQVQWDSADDDLLPDVQPLNGTVTLTPTATAGKLNDALAEIRPVTARIFGGEIVDEDENPGIRVLATDAEVGVEDWAWKATFQLDSGLRLKPLTFKLAAGETISLTKDLIPVDSAPYQLVRGISITGVIDEGNGIIRQTFSDGTESEPIALPPALGIPIFPTLAEAKAWEAEHPGQQALTIEDPSPDTVPPTPGMLRVFPSDTTATLSVTGASDDRRTPLQYSFRAGSGAWTAWQADTTGMVGGLTRSTQYAFQHRVKDGGGNITEGVSVNATTLAQPAWGSMWADSFTAPDGTPLVGRALEVAPSGTAPAWTAVDPLAPIITGGTVSGPEKTFPSYNYLVKYTGGWFDLGFTPTRLLVDAKWVSGSTHGEGLVLLHHMESVTKGNYIQIAGSVAQGWGPLNAGGFPPADFSRAIPGFNGDGPMYGQPHAVQISIDRTGMEGADARITITVDGVVKTASVTRTLYGMGAMIGVGGIGNARLDDVRIVAE